MLIIVPKKSRFYDFNKSAHGELDVTLDFHCKMKNKR